jgi:hypothetical protein
MLNALAGGTVFPGEHHLAKFEVKETQDSMSVTINSKDGNMHVHVSGKVSDKLPETSLFPSLDEASEFFAKGGVGILPSHASKVASMDLNCAVQLGRSNLLPSSASSQASSVIRRGFFRKVAFISTVPC